MRRVRLYLEGSKNFQPVVGCGVRNFIVMSEGRLWTVLFYPPTLTRFRMTNQEFKASIKRDLGPITQVVLDIIARSVKVYDTENLQYSRRAVQQIRKAA